MKEFKSLMNICRILYKTVCGKRKQLRGRKKNTKKTTTKKEEEKTIELEYWIFQSINSRRMCQFFQILHCYTFNRNFEIFKFRNVLLVRFAVAVATAYIQMEFCKPRIWWVVCKWAPISRIIIYNSARNRKERKKMYAPKKKN